MTSAIQGLILCALVCFAAAQKRYCYTRWLDRDNPGGLADYEAHHAFSPSQVCSKPVGIQCQTLSGQDYKSTGDVFAVDCDPRRGLVCYNADQQNGKQCEDYRVRFLCEEGTIRDTTGVECTDYCESPFFDRDNPGGYCDCEQLHLGPYTGPTPVGIRCVEKNSGDDYQLFGQVMTCKPDVGGVCWNANNPGNPCKDYSVQYIHPCEKTYGPISINPVDPLPVGDGPVPLAIKEAARDWVQNMIASMQQLDEADEAVIEENEEW